MSIPQATHLQFLVLDQIAEHPGCSVGFIQERMAEHGVIGIGPSFHQFMKRLKALGWIEGEQVFGLTEEGRRVREDVVGFYRR